MITNKYELDDFQQVSKQTYSINLSAILVVIVVMTELDADNKNFAPVMSSIGKHRYWSYMLHFHWVLSLVRRVLPSSSELIAISVPKCNFCFHFYSFLSFLRLSQPSTKFSFLSVYSILYHRKLWRWTIHLFFLKSPILMTFSLFLLPTFLPVSLVLIYIYTSITLNTNLHRI